MSSSGSRSLRAPRSRSKKGQGAAQATPGPSLRQSAYRGDTREAAAAAYHADARVMARMGFVPESETWSTQLEQVLVVGYVHAPERTKAVLDALEQPEAEPIIDPAPQLPTAWRPPLASQLPLEASLIAGAIGGAATGAAVCLGLAWVSGESPDALILGVFGFIGLLIGSIFGLTRS